MRRIQLLVVLVAVCALLGVATTAWAAKPAAITQVTVNGMVAETAGPAVGGATVVVSYQTKGKYAPVATLTTASDGTWTYVGRKGSYRFEFSAAGADPLTVDATYDTNGTYALAASLQCYGEIAGTVRASASGLPIGPATVEFFAALPGGGWASVASAVVTAPDGAYASPQLPTGSYAVKASVAGYVSAFYGAVTPSAVAVSRAATTPDVDVPLAAVPAYGSISGRVVRNATATPIVGTYVWFFKRNADGTYPPTSPGWGSPTVQVLTDASGNYNSGDLEQGVYKVRFWGGSMTGSQWWQYVATVDLATPVELTESSPTLTGIDGWFNKPL
jgi:hypothetical protein